jgi:hypothetical protein
MMEACLRQLKQQYEALEARLEQKSAAQQVGLHVLLLSLLRCSQSDSRCIYMLVARNYQLAWLEQAVFLPEKCMLGCTATAVFLRSHTS